MATNLFTLMKVFFYLATSVLVIFHSSCSSPDKPYKKETSANGQSFKSVDSSSVSIEVDTTQLSADKFHAVYNTSYLGYNHKAHALDFFDLASKLPTNSVKLDILGPNGLKEISGLIYHNNDSIFVLTENIIALIDATGRINRRIQINRGLDGVNELFKEYVAVNSDAINSFLFNPANSSLYLPGYNRKHSASSSKHYRSPVVLEINLNPKTPVKLVEVTYPHLYVENFYGYMDQPSLSMVTPSSVSVSFPIEPNLYTYDLLKKELKAFGGSKIGNDSLAKPLKWDAFEDEDQKMRHYWESPFYGPLLYDRTDNLYYRLNLRAMNYIAKNGVFPSFNDKQKALTIFNKQLEIIGEIALNDPNYFIQGAFVTPAGLHIPYYSDKTHLSFKVFKFKV